ncbi:poly-gamma-glutamate hydrolase family protein [Salinarchaeum laminariae]|uniref:poly-gamma-glutamate hydrolase family protein n=1 Tax=Salinarchaeum laminariae TaxID=869888 RepID=UPI0020BF7DBF|nr:poly-gamma-glutamate hydrolase family protein [Salinarchaeum laminariae]
MVGPIPMKLSRRRALLAAGTVVGGGALAATEALQSSQDDETQGRMIERHDATLAAASVSGPYPGGDYCTVDQTLASRVGIEAGQQVRVAVDEPSGDVEFQEKCFTVAEIVNTDQNTVTAEADELAQFGASDGADGSVSAHVPHPSLDSREQAWSNDEFVERLVGGSRAIDAGLVALAPHGGVVEYNTGRQAVHVAENYDTVGWACYGYNGDAGAYDRWHITSPALSRASFPKLDSIADVGFDAAIAFHGTSADTVQVGGLGVEARDRVANRLQTAYDDANADVVVEVVTDTELAGQNPNNVVNWITDDGASGVQLELPYDIRSEYHVLTAETAAEAMLDG